MKNDLSRPTCWDEVIGHQAAISRIRRMIEQDKLPHALLFSGPEGIGKRLVAEILAAQLLATQPESLPEHPDYCLLSPDGAQIRIAQVREIQRIAGMASVRGGFRVCLIEPADCMDPPAANCLLKILEEPPPGLVFILVTAFPHALLSTILSRAANIRFYPSPVLNLPVATDPTQRQFALEILQNMDKPGLEWLWPVVAKFDGMESAQILDIIKQWIVLLRDVAVHKSGFAGRAKDLELTALAGGWNMAGLIEAIQLAEATRRQLQRNANARLMLESMFIRSADLYWGGKENADHRRSPV